MPINRYDNPNSTPTIPGDWPALIDLTGASYLQGVIPWTGSTMTEGFVFRLGGSVYRVDGSVSITGTASDYVKITPSGSTATASFVANLSGVTWNAVENGYYDGDGNRYFVSYHYGARIFERVGPWTGTFFPPKGVKQIILTMCGAGGNGVTTGGGTQIRGGGGGGSGAFCIDEIVSVDDETEYSLVLSNSGTSSAFGSDFGKGGNGSALSGGVGAGGTGGVGTGIAQNGSAGGTGNIVSSTTASSGGGAGFMPGGNGDVANSGFGGSYIEGNTARVGMGYKGKSGAGSFGNGNGTNATLTGFMVGGGGAFATNSGGLRAGGNGGYGGGGGSAAAQGGTIGAGGGTGGPAYLRITW